jgi:predicted Rossmann fold flavoprotein
MMISSSLIFLVLRHGHHNDPTRLVRRSFVAVAMSTSSSSSSTRQSSHSSPHHHRPPTHHHPKKIAVIGGGASGIFAAIAAAEHDPSVQVTVLEATSKTLQKVQISGGGRCNVLHDTSKTIPTLLSGYPRGNRELNGIFHKQFTPTMARDWFEVRGVTLKTEPDGRMFPITDSSQTIMDTLLQAAQVQGVDIRLKQKVESIVSTSATTATTTPPHRKRPAASVAEENKNDDDDKNAVVDDYASSSQPQSSSSSSSSFEIQFKSGETEQFDAVILATGSSPTGYDLAQRLGHSLMVPVPSLFTLNCKHDLKPPDGLLFDLSGISVPEARVSLSKKQFQEGPLLITHHGISGPAVLRLSAFGARDFKECNYRGTVTVHWDTSLAGGSEQDLFDELWRCTTLYPKRSIASVCPIPGNHIPRRLWSRLVTSAPVSIPADLVWGNASKKALRTLAQQISACPLEVTGKGTFKEEFVTAGGVKLEEIKMKEMASKVCQGLFLCGEVINVDGVTGGYNFMNCWSTGFLAGHGAAEYCLQQQQQKAAAAAAVPPPSL